MTKAQLEIIERARHIKAHPEDMTEDEIWWRTCAKEEQRLNGIKGRAAQRKRQMELREVRKMSAERLREIVGE